MRASYVASIFRHANHRLMLNLDLDDPINHGWDERGGGVMRSSDSFDDVNCCLIPKEMKKH